MGAAESRGEGKRGRRARLIPGTAPRRSLGPSDQHRKQLSKKKQRRTRIQPDSKGKQREGEKALQGILWMAALSLCSLTTLLFDGHGLMSFSLPLSLFLVTEKPRGIPGHLRTDWVVAIILRNGFNQWDMGHTRGTVLETTLPPPIQHSKVPGCVWSGLHDKTRRMGEFALVGSPSLLGHQGDKVGGSARPILIWDVPSVSLASHLAGCGYSFE